MQGLAEHHGMTHPLDADTEGRVITMPGQEQQGQLPPPTGTCQLTRSLKITEQSHRKNRRIPLAGAVNLQKR